MCVRVRASHRWRRRRYRSHRRRRRRRFIPRRCSVRMRAAVCNALGGRWRGRNSRRFQKKCNYFRSLFLVSRPPLLHQPNILNAYARSPNTSSCLTGNQHPSHSGLVMIWGERPCRGGAKGATAPSSALMQVPRLGHARLQFHLFEVF